MGPPLTPLVMDLFLIFGVLTLGFSGLTPSFTLRIQWQTQETIWEAED